MRSGAYLVSSAVCGCLGPRRLNREKVMSRAVSSAPWGLAQWCLAVAPIPPGGGGTRTTASCPGKCPEHETPRQPVTSGAPTPCARRGAECIPAATSPPPPVQHPTGPALCGGLCSGRPHAAAAPPAAGLFIQIRLNPLARSRGFKRHQQTA